MAIRPAPLTAVRSGPRSGRAAVAVVLALTLTLAGLLAGCGGDEAVLVGVEREAAPAVGSVSLPDTNGQEFAFVAPQDELLVVYFGFTNCPDICPTTLADLRRALDSLDEAESSRVNVAMATIDPERDTDEVVAGYVTSFVPDAIALRTADEAALREATGAFGADYSVVAPAEPGQAPEVGHTTSLYAVDDQGDMVLTWLFGTTADDIANDLQILLERA